MGSGNKMTELNEEVNDISIDAENLLLPENDKYEVVNQELEVVSSADNNPSIHFIAKVFSDILEC